MMMEAANTSETSVNFYQTTRRCNPEYSQLHGCSRNLSDTDVHTFIADILIQLQTFLQFTAVSLYFINMAYSVSKGIFQRTLADLHELLVERHVRWTAANQNEIRSVTSSAGPNTKLNRHVWNTWAV
jgi:hypothetical protein